MLQIIIIHLFTIWINKLECVISGKRFPEWRIAAVKKQGMLLLPRGLYYKTLRICNLREMDRFCSEQVTFSLDKYTNLKIQTR
jgi:hypothetical protein